MGTAKRISQVVMILAALTMISCERAQPPRSYILVGSCWHGAILRYHGETGRFIDTLVKQGGELVCAEGDGIIGPDGNLYVTNFNPGRIDRFGQSRDSVLRYNPNTGDFLGAFVAPSPQLEGPHGLAFGPDGNLYVSTRFTDSILRYNGRTGDFMGVFVEPGAGGLDDADRMVFKDDHLYVVSLENAAILRYEARTGRFVDVFVRPGSGGLSRPHDLLFGPDGDLYVSSFPNNSVLRFNGRSGEFVDAFIPQGSADINYIGNMKFGADGNFYLTSCADNKVMRFDRSGKFLDNFVAPGSGGLLGTTFMLFVPSST
jgi:DNA-binding beta-propeller fold protein YncE